MRWEYQLIPYFICMLLFDSCFTDQSYTMDFESMRFTLKDDQTTVDVSRIQLMGRNRVINGTVSLFEDLDMKFEVSAVFAIDSYGTGEFRPLPYNITNMPVCEAVIQYGSYLEPSLVEGVNTNFPVNRAVCPIEKGEYFFTEIDIKPDNLPSVVPRGLLKSNVYFTKDNVTIVELEVFARIRDKYYK